MSPISDKYRKYAIHFLSLSLLSPCDAHLPISKLYISKLLSVAIFIFILAKGPTFLGASLPPSFSFLIVSS